MKIELDRASYTKLNQQLDRKHEMEWAKGDDYGPQMAGFIRQLDNAVKKNKASHLFTVSLCVADALACEKYDCAAIFSNAYFNTL